MLPAVSQIHIQCDVWGCCLKASQSHTLLNTWPLGVVALCPGDERKDELSPFLQNLPVCCCVQRRHRRDTQTHTTHHTHTQRCGVMVVVRARCALSVFRDCQNVPEGCATCLAMDSGLDAFSQYPSHGSFATPVARLIAETRGATRGFLSYYHVLPSSHPRMLLPHPKTHIHTTRGE